MRFIVLQRVRLLLSAHDFSWMMFSGAILLYACFSSPTPDNPGLIEIIILLLFILALGIGNIYQSIFKIQKVTIRPKWHWAVFCLFLYGITVPVIVSIGHHISLSVFIRDMIGFLFLCLPLFFGSFLLHVPARQKKMIILCLSIGIIFSIRVLFSDFSFLTQRQELLYLANSPLVLFTALYLILSSVNFIIKNNTIRSYCAAGLFMMLSAIPLAAMYIDFQRASFLAVGVSLSLLFVIRFFKVPLRTLFPIFLLSVLAIIFHQHISGVFDSISVKTSRVGLNMRVEEFLAVWDASRQSIVHLLFGHGWGASFASPAVGDLHVSYTHSLLTYSLLKAGLIGVGLTVVYLFFIFEKLCRLVFIEPVKGSALVWPFIIPVLLYASYKSLDYGLILVLVIAIDAQFRQKDEKVNGSDIALKNE